MFLALVLGPDRAASEQVVDLVPVNQRALHVLQSFHDQRLGSGWADLITKRGLQKSKQILNKVAVEGLKGDKFLNLCDDRVLIYRLTDRNSNR